MLSCGLLGEKLGHSYSPQIHSLMADYEYKLYEKTPEQLEDFLKKGQWNGLNVTIPYKKTVFGFCDNVSSLAQKTGSINTLVKDGQGRIYGDNTDAFGFERLMAKNGIDPAGMKTLILGNGGACASVKAVLEMKGADVCVISRKGKDNYNNLDLHKDVRLIVNTTPVGMYPDTDKSPVDLRLFPKCEAVLDIIYNPARTKILMQAEELGIKCANGLYMLSAQAKRSSELFAGGQLPDKIIDEITDRLSYEMQNIVLIGMPGSGKSTVAESLAKLTGRDIAELDEEFTRKYGISPAQCLKENEEGYFRQLESEVIREFSKKSGMILSTGGGCVTVPANYPLLHQNSVIIWIRRDLEKLPTEGRPLSQKNNLEDMYRLRKPLYEKFADHAVDNDTDADETANRILKQLYEDPFMCD